MLLKFDQFMSYYKGKKNKKILQKLKPGRITHNHYWNIECLGEQLLLDV